MAEEFEEYQSVTLTDDEGNDIEFELVDAIEHGGKKYCVLKPADSADEDDFVILEYVFDENGDYLEEIAGEDEYDEIYGIYLDGEDE